MLCKLRSSEQLKSGAIAFDDAFCAAMTDLLLELVNYTPIEILARTVLAFEAIDAGRSMYGAYDDFLGILADVDNRKHLESLSVASAFSDSLFRQAREIGTRFQEGLTGLFFATDEQLTKLTQRYGVF